jgi:hypothetical protein
MAAAAVLYVPRGQSVQAAEPLTSLKLPGAHAVHSTPTVKNCSSLTAGHTLGVWPSMSRSLKKRPLTLGKSNCVASVGDGFGIEILGAESDFQSTPSSLMSRVAETRRPPNVKISIPDTVTLPPRSNVSQHPEPEPQCHMVDALPSNTCRRQFLLLCAHAGDATPMKLLSDEEDAPYAQLGFLDQVLAVHVPPMVEGVDGGGEEPTPSHTYTLHISACATANANRRRAHSQTARM